MFMTFQIKSFKSKHFLKGFETSNSSLFESLKKGQIFRTLIGLENINL